MGAWEAGGGGGGGSYYWNDVYSKPLRGAIVAYVVKVKENTKIALKLKQNTLSVMYTNYDEN